MALKLENTVTDASPEAVIPYIGETELWRMLTDALNVARVDVVRAAAEQPQGEQKHGRGGEEQEATRDSAEQEQGKEAENRPDSTLMTEAEEPEAQPDADSETEQTVNGKKKPPPGSWDGWWEEDGSEVGSPSAEEKPAEPAPPLSRTEKQRRRREELMRSRAGIRQAIREGWYKPEH